MLTLTPYETEALHPDRRPLPQAASRNHVDEFPIPEPEPLIDRFDLLYLVKKYFRVLVAIPAAFVVLAIVYHLLKAPIYQSTAVIYIDPKFDQILRFEKFDGGNSTDLDSLSSLEIMIMADSMVLRVAQKLDLKNQEGCLPPELAENPDLPDQKLVRFLQNNRFSAHLSPGTRLLNINVLDPDPERSRLIASTFASEFDKFLIERRQDEARQARAVLERQVADSKRAALEAEDKLREFRESNPGFPVEQDHDMFAARLTQFSNDLNTVVSQRMELESQLEYLQGIDPHASPLVIVEVTGYQSAEHVRTLLGLHATASAQLASAKSTMVASDPRLLAIAGEFERYDAQLRELASEIKVAIRSKYEATKKREEGLRAQLETIQHELVGVKSLSSEFRALQQQSERQWLVHGTLQTRLSESVMASDSVSNIATEVSQPMRPYKKASSNIIVLLIIAGGLGSLVSATYVGAKILTGVPYTDKSQLARHGLPLIADWTKAEALPAPGEAAIFLHSLGANRSKTIHFLSPDSATTAAEVAGAIAQMTSGSGARSLLVTISPTAGSGNGTGHEFSESGAFSHLTVTPQGAMHEQALENYLVQFSDQFQHVFLEGSACKGDDVTQWLSTLSDKNVVVVGKGAAPKRSVDDWLARLTTPGMPPLGLIMIDPELGGLRPGLPTSRRISPPKPREYARAS